MQINHIRIITVCFRTDFCLAFFHNNVSTSHSLFRRHNSWINDFSGIIVFLFNRTDIKIRKLRLTLLNCHKYIIAAYFFRIILVIVNTFHHTVEIVITGSGIFRNGIRCCLCSISNQCLTGTVFRFAYIPLALITGSCRRCYFYFYFDG